MWISLIAFAVFVAGFIIGAGAGAKRIGKLMRTPKFWEALPDHILREIRYRCVHELEARRSDDDETMSEPATWVSGEENTAEACGVGIGGHEWRDADAVARVRTPLKKEG